MAKAKATSGYADGVVVGSPDVGRLDLMKEEIEVNAGRRTVELTVENTGDRPVQVGSHFHFFEVNGALAFDRPSACDRVHLADTGLVIQIERDFNTYGDEAVFGGGKTLRDGMGQAPGVTAEEGALDFVITNAIIMDSELGIVKGDVGIKDGKIVGVGKAGNPDVMDVTPGLVVSANTDILSVEGMIVTPGGIDVHVHFDCAQLHWAALSNG